MADIIDSDNAAKEEVHGEEGDSDRKPITTFKSDKQWFITEETNSSEKLNGNYLNDWCTTDQNENKTEIIYTEHKKIFTGPYNKYENVEPEKELKESEFEFKFEVTKEEEQAEAVENKDLEEDNYYDAQPIPTLEELANSDYLHNRQLAARKILEFLQQAGSDEKDLQSVISVMCKLSEDEETMVQYELMQNIPAIATYCQSKPHLQIVIRQQLMPYTVKLLSDAQVIIRKSGHSALLLLLEKNLIDYSQLNEWICPLVSQLVTCESNREELRVEDVSLMNKMIPFIGPEITFKFFLDPIVTLCCDQAVGIRKMCALGFGTLCKVVGVYVTEQSLLPAFLNLLNDEMWHVRKACADVFVDVANSVSMKTRKEILSYLFVNLLTDNHNSVKYSAYQNLGTFIYTFADPSLTGCSYQNGELIVDSNNTWEKSKQRSTENQVSLVEELRAPSSTCENLRDVQNKCIAHNIRKARMHMGHLSKGGKSNISTTANRNSHLSLHVDNEKSSFNNFQFWRVPLPEVELDIDFEDGKATNIHVRATVQGTENLQPSSEIKVHIASDKSSDSESSSVSKSNEVNTMLVQTACINTLSSSQDRLLDDDTEILWSSFKEAVLTFKPEESDLQVDSTNLSLSSVVEAKEEIVKKAIAVDMTPYDQNIVPPILLFSFITVVNNYPYEVNKAYEDEKLGFIAYSFPAVAYTLGRKYWPCIKKTCEKLARNMKWTVRRTIASSLHELATILGYDIIMSDLLPIFLDLFKDVDEVRLRLVQHLSDFLKHLHPEDRKQFLPLIEEFTKVDNDKNWRFRSAVAEQLIKTVDLYDAAEIPEYFLPVASSLLHDKVAAVRLSAVELMAVLLKYMLRNSGTKNYFETMLGGVDDLYRQAPKWVWRQTYIKLCEQFVLKETMCMSEFVERIAPKLLSLAWDEVPNVRLVLIRGLCTTLIPNDFISHITTSSSHDLLIKALNSLKLDVDKDVRYYAEQFWSSYLASVYTPISTTPVDKNF